MACFITQFMTAMRRPGATAAKVPPIHLATGWRVRSITRSFCRPIRDFKGCANLAQRFQRGRLAFRHLVTPWVISKYAL